jgi:hypothetical protein
MQAGLIEHWTCTTEEWAVWGPSERSRNIMESARLTDFAPSYIQEDHLRSGKEEERGIQRLIYVAFTVNDVYDREAIERTFTEHVRRHETYRTQYVDTKDGCRARYLQPDEVDLEVTASSDNCSPGMTVKDFLQYELPGLDQWASFAFGVSGTENATPDSTSPQFTVLLAADHIFTDAISLSISFYEILMRYAAFREGRQYELPPVRPYRDFSAGQRKHIEGKTNSDPDIVRWRRIIGNAGGMPKFPLPLGLSTDRTTAHYPGIAAEMAFLDAAQVEALASVAKRCGGSIGSALLAAQAAVHRDLTGSDIFTMMTPRSHRPTPQDLLSVGWFVTLVPVQFSTQGDLATLIAAAHKAQGEAKALENTPVFPVIDLLSEDEGFPVEHGSDAPMLSYIDITKTPGADLAHAHEVSLYSNATPRSEVYIWINRDVGGLDFRAMYPGTPEAEASVHEYFSLMRAQLLQMATGGLDLTSAESR